MTNRDYQRGLEKHHITPIINHLNISWDNVEIGDEPDVIIRNYKGKDIGVENIEYHSTQHIQETDAKLYKICKEYEGILKERGEVGFILNVNFSDDVYSVKRLDDQKVLEDIESGRELFLPVTTRQKLARALKCSPSEIKKYDVALTLGIGERSKEEYKSFKDAGADRFLLRIETTDKSLYLKLHPNMSFENRLRCLYDLKELGYEVGTGCLVGLPNQTLESLADDILFFKELDVDMVGIGPLIIHPDTPLKNFDNGSFNLALKVMAITRLLLPDINIPATTAMETLVKNGFNLVSGGTDTHLILVDLRSKGITGKEADLALENAGITCNKNGIPNDPNPPAITSGIRLGVPAITTRGFNEEDVVEVANLITEVVDDFVKNKDYESDTIKNVREKVKNLCKKHPIY